jgi:hypothetical protein
MLPLAWQQRVVWLWKSIKAGMVKKPLPGQRAKAQLSLTRP